MLHLLTSFTEMRISFSSWTCSQCCLCSIRQPAHFSEIGQFCILNPFLIKMRKCYDKTCDGFVSFFHEL